MINTTKSDFDKRCLFHLHTNYTDGEMNVENYFTYAKKYNYTSLVFLEHIRKHPSYDTQKYIAEIRHHEKRTGIKAFAGFEASLRKDGSLDISEKDIKRCDVLGMAEHRLPNELGGYLRALTIAIQQWKDIPRVWLHPGMWFQKRKILNEKFLVYRKMLNLAVEEGWLIEHNIKYDLIPYKMKGIVPSKHLITGVDSHKITDLY